MRTIFDGLDNKSLSRRGTWGPLSNLESGHAAPFLHRISVVRVYLYIAATTPDPAGWDLRHFPPDTHTCETPSQSPERKQTANSTPAYMKMGEQKV